MKNENNIDNYFDKVKQNPPLIPIEKVRQIITSPDARARLKGNNRNLLKFTIMTTIFTIIISAVLMWPGEDSKESSIKYQVSRQVSDERAGNAVSKVFENSTKVAEKGSKSSDENFIAKSNLNKATLDVEIRNAVAANPQQVITNNQEKIVEPAQLNGQKPIDFDPATIQPIDGSRFILKLNNDELKKIGFEVTDSSYDYKQQVGTTFFNYNFKILRRKPFERDSMGNIHVLENEPIFTIGHSGSALQSYDEYPKLENYKYDFYPVFKTNLFYSDINDNGKTKKEDFNMANDTLLPVILPVSKLYPNEQDKLFWFTTTEKLFSVLSPSHKAIVEEFRKYKVAKKAYPLKDLVIYQPPKMFDESKVVVLSKNELTKFGFQFLSDSTIYKGSTQKVKIEYYKTINASGSTTRNGLSLKTYTNILAMMVTRTDGSPVAKFNDLLETYGLQDKEYGSQFPLLIPILMKSSAPIFTEDLIFWFYPTDELFKALPDRIGKALKIEYNYVVAEDKSTLEKPECVYFEECKNTLPISKFKVYPNPANSNITVSFTLPEAINGRITLIDLAGRERQVLQPNTNYAKGSHQFEVDLSSVPEGIYLIALYSDKGIQTQRLIVAR